MPSFTKLFTLVACAATALAAAHPDAIHAHCAGAKLLKEAHVTVDGGVIKVSDFSCDASGRITSRDAMAKRATDVCGELCSNSCNDNAGNLPPVVADCDKIRNSVAVLGSNISPEFTVSGHGAKVLTFETCSFIFTNNVATSLTQCWTSMVTQASQAGAGCFPPVQPFFSEGICTGGTWSVAAAHSSN